MVSRFAFFFMCSRTAGLMQNKKRVGINENTTARASNEGERGYFTTVLCLLLE